MKSAARGPLRLRTPSAGSHNPKNAAARRRMASRAARSKPNKEAKRCKEEIQLIINEVMEKKLNRNDASVMIAGYRAIKEFIELERRLEEADVRAEFEELKRELGVS